VSPAGAGVTEFAWVAARDGERLVFSVLHANSYSSRVLLATASSAGLRSLGSYADLIGFSVAPSGDDLAVSYRQGTPPAPGKAPTWEGVLQVRPLSGGPGRTVYTLPEGGYVLPAPGWWPDGKGLLFWDDPAGSASIAADGLTLDSLNLAAGKVSALGTMLTYPNWVSWSPGGRSLAFVAGGDRVIWDAGKHVVVCAMPSASCRSVALRSARLMALDPIWAAAGSLVYDAAPGARSPSASTPPGLPTVGTAAWSQQNVAAWYAAMHLYAAGASGAGGHLLAGAGSGAHDPRAVPGGLLFIRGNGLWYLPGGARRAAMKVVGGLASPSPYGNYYGYIAWYQDFAWHA
jgi:hypothetical protein